MENDKKTIDLSQLVEKLLNENGGPSQRRLEKASGALCPHIQAGVKVEELVEALYRQSQAPLVISLAELAKRSECLAEGLYQGELGGELSELLLKQVNALSEDSNLTVLKTLETPLLLAQARDFVDRMEFKTSDNWEIQGMEADLDPRTGEISFSCDMAWAARVLECDDCGERVLVAEWVDPEDGLQVRNYQLMLAWMLQASPEMPLGSDFNMSEASRLFKEEIGTAANLYQEKHKEACQEALAEEVAGKELTAWVQRGDFANNYRLILAQGEKVPQGVEDLEPLTAAEFAEHWFRYRGDPMNQNCVSLSVIGADEVQISL